MATSMLLMTRRCNQMGCWLSSLSCSPSCCMCAIILLAAQHVLQPDCHTQLNVGHKGRILQASCQGQL